jgi:hypothetical protein
MARTFTMHPYTTSLIAPLPSPVFLIPHHAQGGNALGPEGADKLAGALGLMTGMQTLGLVRGRCVGTRSLVQCDGGGGWDVKAERGGRELLAWDRAAGISRRSSDCGVLLRGCLIAAAAKLVGASMEEKAGRM